MFKEKFPSQSFSRQSSSKGSGCLMLFGLPFMLAGAAMLYFLVLTPFFKYQESKNWLEKPCEIISSSLKTHSDSDGDTYSPEITYKYIFEGKQYESNQLDFTGFSSSSDYSGENSAVLGYPAGSQAVCYVNPENPNEAVLQKEWGRGAFKWVAIPFGGVFFCVGLGIILMGYFSMKGGKPKLNRNSGEVILTPTKQRLGSIGGYLFINIFWNGIVSVFLVFWISNLFSNNSKGFMETWGLGLFLTPFLAIGGFMFWGLLKEIKKYFSPKISLVLKEGTTWRVGQEVEIRWEIPYSAQIDAIILDFICKESATYRRGTTTSTDTEIVATINICEKRGSNFSEREEFKIPEELYPSFYASNNTVTWWLRVKTTGAVNNAEDLYEIQLIDDEVRL